MTQNRIDPALLLSAYAQGIFPMSDGADDPDVHWVEPHLRAIMPLDGFHLSRSLKKALLADDIRVTTDQSFAEMMQLCAAPAPDRPSTWINPTIKASYERLHRMGYAHSVECWQDGALVGGLYGVCLGRAFFGESMVSRVTNASKIALAHLVARLRVGGWKLLDCQFMTPHLQSLGAVEMPQEQYLQRLYSALSADGAAGSEGAAAGAAGTGAAAEAALLSPPSPPFPAGNWGALDALVAEVCEGKTMASPPGYVIAQLLTNTS
jgi:leucyl/phenylalanyl-tRNA--protein transferase